jgi:hypothetical protein
MPASVARSTSVRVMLGVLCCAVATACDFRPVGSSGNWTFGACSSGPYAVSSLVFVPADTLRLRVGEADSVQVRALDAVGASGEFCGPRITVTPAAPAIATVAGSGGGIVRVSVRGVSPGSTLLHAVSGGRRDSLAVIVRP